MRVYRAKDGRVMRYGCKECHHAKIRMEKVVYKISGKEQKRRASVITCPFDECPYFKGAKSFKDFLKGEEYKAQFELETGLDMNDLRGQPGDIPLGL